MRDDWFVPVVLTSCLVCAVLLVAQRVPGAGLRVFADGADAAPVGRFGVTELSGRAVAPYPLLLHDSADGRIWLMKNYRSQYPLLIPFETMPTLAAVDRSRPPPPDTQQQLIDTVAAGASPMLRAWAADQLGLGPYDTAAVVPALIQALRDEDATVAAFAALSLGRKPDPSALPALREALSHPDPRVVENAQQAIDEIE